jgi:hypothetical protein
MNVYGDALEDSLRVANSKVVSKSEAWLVGHWWTRANEPS